MSDWFAAKTTVASALAGMDVEMPFMSYYGELEAAVLAGEVSEALIDEAVTRILRVKFKWDFAYLDQNRSEEHTSELQSLVNLVCRLLLEQTTLLKKIQ